MSRIDTNSESWSEVSDWANEELRKARTLLESEATGPDQTVGLRARIKLLKRLLELPSESAPKDEPGVAFGITPPVS
jgi:hypothetical protein